MKTFFEYLIATAIPLFVFWGSYWLGGDIIREMGILKASELWADQTLLAIGLSLLSVLTWVLIYQQCRRLPSLMLPLMGFFSPMVSLVLAVVFYAAISLFWGKEYFIMTMILPGLLGLGLVAGSWLFFPMGIGIGFLVMYATLPMRQRRERQLGRL